MSSGPELRILSTFSVGPKFKLTRVPIYWEGWDLPGLKPPMMSRSIPDLVAAAVFYRMILLANDDSGCDSLAVKLACIILINGSIF